MITVRFAPTNYVQRFEDKYFVESKDSGEFKVMGVFDNYGDANDFAQVVFKRGRAAVYIFTRTEQVLSLHQPFVVESGPSRCAA